MNKTPDQPSPKDRAQALLGLALSEPDRPESPPPTPEEIAAFYDGQLKGERLQQVKAHLARSDDSFAELAELIYATDSAPQLPPVRWRERTTRFLKGWWGLAAGSGLATAATAVLVLALLLPGLPLQTEVDEVYDELKGIPGFTLSTERWPAPRSGTTTKSTAQGNWKDPARAALGAGLRDELDRLAPKTDFWREVKGRFPVKPLPCKERTDSGACEAFVDLTRSFGQWLALVQSACILDEPAAWALDDRFWVRQRVLFEQFAERFTETQGHRGFRRRLSGWNDSLSKTESAREGLCSGVGRLVMYAAGF